MLTSCRAAVFQSLLTVLSLAPGSATPITTRPQPADDETLPANRRAALQIEAATKAIEARDWKTAVELLQGLIDRDEDIVFAVKDKGPDGRERQRFVGVRSEALRLLEALPGEGRKQYEAAFGVEAAKLLADAEERKDGDAILKVSRRFPTTRAGIKATEEAAEWFTLNDQSLLASLLYEALLRHRPVAEWSGETLLEAVVPLRRIQHPAAAAIEAELFRRLSTDGKELKADLDRRVKLTALLPGERRSYHGEVIRPLPEPNRAPVLERMAAMPTVDSNASIRERLKTVVEQMAMKGELVLPAFQPSTVVLNRPKDGRRTPIAFYRSHWGLHAYDLLDKKMYWKTSMNWSLEKTIGDTKYFAAVNSWLDWFRDQGKMPNILFENSTIGSISTDGNLVFAVDDIEVPPPPMPGMGIIEIDTRYDSRPNPNVNEQLRGAIFHSELRAYSAASGKLVWEQGQKPAEDGKPSKGAKDLRDSYFLGPPLPLEGQLYVLTEKAQVFRLITLDPKSGKLLSVLPLAKAHTALALDPLRRTDAIPMTYGDGVLVCPTNAGTIFGVDLVTGNLRWSHTYVEPLPEIQGPPTPVDPRRVPVVEPLIASNWKMAAFVVRNGKVVFTARDSDAVHCVNLRDGTPVWTHKRQDDDCYFAGIDGDKVLIVGKKTVRALSLDKGETVWKLETGLPSGRGVFGTDGRYYLPLKESAKDKKPGVAILDMAKGTIASLVNSPKDEVPGNLIFFNDMLLSQTATELVVYPLAK